MRYHSLSCFIRMFSYFSYYVFFFMSPPSLFVHKICLHAKKIGVERIIGKYSYWASICFYIVSFRWKVRLLAYLCAIVLLIKIVVTWNNYMSLTRKLLFSSLYFLWAFKGTGKVLWVFRLKWCWYMICTKLLISCQCIWSLRMMGWWILYYTFYETSFDESK